MASNPHLSNGSKSAATDAVTTRLNGGTVEIRSGTQPASPDAAPSDGALLATFNLPNPAFAAAVNGVAAIGVIAAVVAAATGVASWFRFYRSAANGSTAELDGTVGTANADMIIDSVNIQQNAHVQINSFTYTQQG